MQSAGLTQEGQSDRSQRVPYDDPRDRADRDSRGIPMQGSDGGEIAFSGANNAYSAWTRTDTQSSFLIPVQETLLDPAFWRALGRALGWDVSCDLVITCVHGDEECQRCHGYYWIEVISI
jgi:hypothetical protein